MHVNMCLGKESWQEHRGILEECTTCLRTLAKKGALSTTPEFLSALTQGGA